jgi:hypothetical protein
MALDASQYAVLAVSGGKRLATQMDRVEETLDPVDLAILYWRLVHRGRGDGMWSPPMPPDAIEIGLPIVKLVAEHPSDELDQQARVRARAWLDEHPSELEEARARASRWLDDHPSGQFRRATRPLPLPAYRS